jgi:hypothetical protein
MVCVKFERLVVSVYPILLFVGEGGFFAKADISFFKMKLIYMLSNGVLTR